MNIEEMSGDKVESSCFMFYITQSKSKDKLTIATSLLRLPQTYCIFVIIHLERSVAGKWKKSVM